MRRRGLSKRDIPTTEAWHFLIFMCSSAKDKRQVLQPETDGSDDQKAYLNEKFKKVAEEHTNDLNPLVNSLMAGPGKQ